jgi:hypothetical protein
MKRGKKRATVNTLGWVSPFPPFFASFLPLFLHFIQSGCSYCSSEVIYYLKCSKRTGVIFSGFYSPLSAKLKKGTKRAVPKGCKQGAKGAIVNNPIFTNNFNASHPTILIL